MEPSLSQMIKIPYIVHGNGASTLALSWINNGSMIFYFYGTIPGIANGSMMCHGMDKNSKKDFAKVFISKFCNCRVIFLSWTD